MSKTPEDKPASQEIETAPFARPVATPPAEVTQRPKTSDVDLDGRPKQDPVVRVGGSIGATEGVRVSNVFVGSSISVSGDNYGVVHTNNSARQRETDRATAGQRKANFIEAFLTQALRQAQITFYMSIIFMTLGGVIVLCSGAVALSSAAAGSAPHALALVSGLGGIIVGGSGAAFAARANTARKHLAEQAGRIHEELLSERRFEQATELVKGIRDDSISDQARISLASMILKPETSSSPSDTSPEN